MKSALVMKKSQSRGKLGKDNTCRGRKKEWGNKCRGKQEKGEISKGQN